MIGSGIFLKPLAVAQSLPCEWAIYAMWGGLGLVCLFGAFAYAELGAMLPEAGGQYAFLREGWGRFIAFLYGWTFFWVINAGTVAALALGIAGNLLPLWLDEAALGAEQQAPFWQLIVAIGMILLLAVGQPLRRRAGCDRAERHHGRQGRRARAAGRRRVVCRQRQCVHRSRCAGGGGREAVDHGRPGRCVHGHLLGLRGLVSDAVQRGGAEASRA